MTEIHEGYGWGRTMPSTNKIDRVIQAPADDERMQTVMGAFQLGDLSDCEFSRIMRHEFHLSVYEIEEMIRQFKGDV